MCCSWMADAQVNFQVSLAFSQGVRKEDLNLGILSLIHVVLSVLGGCSHLVHLFKDFRGKVDKSLLFSS